MMIDGVLTLVEAVDEVEETKNFANFRESESPPFGLRQYR